MACYIIGGGWGCLRSLLSIPVFVIILVTKYDLVQCTIWDVKGIAHISLIKHKWFEVIACSKQFNTWG